MRLAKPRPRAAQDPVLDWGTSRCCSWSMPPTWASARPQGTRVPEAFEIALRSLKA